MPTERKRTLFQKIIGEAIASKPWPKFTEEQVTFLEGEFPPRCLGTKESVEDHLRYAGKVELIAMMRRSSLPGTEPNALQFLSEEEQEAALEAEAIETATKLAHQ
jgi:hypothetical protein